MASRPCSAESQSPAFMAVSTDIQAVVSCPRASSSRRDCSVTAASSRARRCCSLTAAAPVSLGRGEVSLEQRPRCAAAARSRWYSAKPCVDLLLLRRDLGVLLLPVRLELLLELGGALLVEGGDLLLERDSGGAGALQPLPLGGELGGEGVAQDLLAPGDLRVASRPQVDQLPAQVVDPRLDADDLAVLRRELLLALLDHRADDAASPTGFSAVRATIVCSLASNRRGQDIHPGGDQGGGAEVDEQGNSAPLRPALIARSAFPTGLRTRPRGRRSAR